MPGQARHDQTQQHRTGTAAHRLHGIAEQSGGGIRLGPVTSQDLQIPE